MTQKKQTVRHWKSVAASSLERSCATRSLSSTLLPISPAYRWRKNMYGSCSRWFTNDADPRTAIAISWRRSTDP